MDDRLTNPLPFIPRPPSITQLARRVLRRTSRIVFRHIPDALATRTHREIPGRVHLSDGMLESRTDLWSRYAHVGRSAFLNIEADLQAAGRSWSAIQHALDLPCGHGRVLRWIVTKVPAARVTACDLDAHGVAFCARAFGVEPVRSDPNPAKIKLPRQYDLIWVGSLLTHVPEEEGWAFLDRFHAALTPGGLLIVTTHDESCLEHASLYGPTVVTALPALRAAMRAGTGVAFVPSTHGARYGTAFHRRDWFRAAVAARYGQRLRLIRHTPRGWDDHQDIWALMRDA